jgi:dihydroorotase
MHLCFNEQSLSDFNTNFKIYPPLRAESDRKALVSAVCEGDIEIVTAHHRPVHSDEKDREFGAAAYGASGLETCFRALLTLENEGLTLKRIIEILALNPRKLLGLDIPGLKPASLASFTFFKTSPPSAITPSTLRSRSHNNPFIGSELPGEVVGIFHGGRMIF